MIKRISIEDTTNGDEGILQYDDDPNQKIIIWGLQDGPDTLRVKLNKYFSTERTVKVAVSDVMDDYEEISGLPVKDINIFQLSLNTLFINTGIKLNKMLNK